MIFHSFINQDLQQNLIGGLDDVYYRHYIEAWAAINQPFL
jgi:hypothetical protein